jgi:hypothetical protein
MPARVVARGGKPTDNTAAVHTELRQSASNGLMDYLFTRFGHRKRRRGTVYPTERSQRRSHPARPGRPTQCGNGAGLDDDERGTSTGCGRLG